MCQLLGMNCNTPTDVTFSFTGFAQRGGRTDLGEMAQLAAVESLRHASHLLSVSKANPRR
jgi:hypothetical protein